MLRRSRDIKNAVRPLVHARACRSSCSRCPSHRVSNSVSAFACVRFLLQTCQRLLTAALKTINMLSFGESCAYSGSTENISQPPIRVVMLQACQCAASCTIPVLYLPCIKQVWLLALRRRNRGNSPASHSPTPLPQWARS